LTTLFAQKSDVPYTRQHIDADDIAAVTTVLRSDWLTTGPKIDEFEEHVAAYCGTKFTVAVSSATAGLHAALRALGVGPGDRVWTSPNSFVASANCALYCGATVDFVDIDPTTYNLSAHELDKKLAAAEKTRSLPKAIVTVHYGGQPCDLEAIAALTQPHGIHVIEDASHALGATYRGEPVGACRFSDATIFSFQATKSIAAGEGGMVATNREEIANGVRLFRGHGITREPQHMTAVHKDEPWRYEQIDLGFNYRMTDIQAALASSQLAKLDAFVRRRRELAARYDEAFENVTLQLPHRDTKSASAWHLYPIHVLGNDRKRLRRHLYDELSRHGIQSQVHFMPIHTQPYYRRLGFRDGDFPAAERYYQGALSLPLFFDLEETDQDRVIDVVRSVVVRR
jgi:UDP-4-amino-4,6-dideoxy-N-acetyl-beta-L-altrosamine transaminase